MRGVRSAPRGTRVAKSLRAVRQATSGSLRPGASRARIDKRIVARKTRGPLALPRGAARRARREHSLAGRRLDAAFTCAEIGKACWTRRAFHQGRVAEPDTEFQGARNGYGCFDGERV